MISMQNAEKADQLPVDHLARIFHEPRHGVAADMTLLLSEL